MLAPAAWLAPKLGKHQAFLMCIQTCVLPLDVDVCRNMRADMRVSRYAGRHVVMAQVVMAQGVMVQVVKPKNIKSE